MTTVSISELKTRPSKIISESIDYPVAVENRNKIKAYLIGKDLFEKIIDYLENYIDTKAVEETDFSRGKDFEKVARDLGI